MPLDRTIDGALEVRRADLARFEESAGGVFDNSFVVDIAGTGDTTWPLDFTLRFVERPFVLTGWEMAPSQRVKPVPKISFGVFVWKLGKHSPTGLLFYDGCTLAISVDADPSLIASLHVSFSGKAIRSPNGRDQIVLG